MKNSFFPKLGILFLWMFFIFSSIRITTQSSLFNNEKNTIHLFTWPELFNYDLIQEFEKESGIKVVVHHFATNEELVTKLKKTQGKGYDLISPSDYTVKILREKKLLKPLDKTRLTFFEDLDPFLLDRSYDPNNKYSIPFSWEVFGFGMDKKFLAKQKEIPTWDLIFNENDIDYQIAMSNDPIEALRFASFYLHGHKKNLNSKELENVKNLLIKQKSWIEAYTTIRGDYLLVTENCQVALCPSAYLLRAIQLNSNIEFVLPKDGSFLSIENLVIPNSSEKQEQVYQFINYMYKPENIIKNTNRYLTFPSRLDIIKDLETPEAFKKALQEVRQEKDKVRTIEFLMPEKQARQTWVEIKSS